jgi:hypothetical protein
MSAVNILTDVKGRLIPFLSGSVPPGEINKLLADGAREFAQASRTLMNKVTVGVVAEQEKYPLTPQMDGTVLQIERVWSRTASDIEDDKDGTLIPEHGYAWDPDDGSGTLELLGGYVPASTLAGGLRVEFAVLPDSYVYDGYPSGWLAENVDAIVWTCRALLAERPEATEQQKAVASLAGQKSSFLANKARQRLTRYGRAGAGGFYL